MFSFGLSGETVLWAPIIRAAGRHLQSVSVSMVDRASRQSYSFSLPSESFAEADEYENDHAYILDNMANCSSLKSVSLKYLPHLLGNYDSPPSDGFVRALRDVLEREQVTWPALQRLHLQLPDREGQEPFVTAELGNDLARALLNRKRYPHFKRLIVRIVHESWHEDSPRWLPTASVKITPWDRAVIVRRWKTALSAFEGIAGITLDVDLWWAQRRS
ncbi:hypothetical protein PYCCODRAFT_1440379 [Trametes coccinea BRFM310]|uniref:Uncharacterized protein n=1 Tax=Trametes coccinea (strain BRFM310) TaxID=1353009 RepID=A0A1Y2I819_TRAC3|nr:hypothetical protein PYCCODRAFT_1440379 [Trametes coccinea BRFM310]